MATLPQNMSSWPAVYLATDQSVFDVCVCVWVGGCVGACVCVHRCACRRYNLPMTRSTDLATVAIVEDKGPSERDDVV
jgi:hypothetical protein